MGMRFRQIKSTTKKIDGQDVVVPVLDENDAEIELWSVDVPQEIEHHGGVPADVVAEGKEAIEEFIAAKLEELAAAKEE